MKKIFFAFLFAAAFYYSEAQQEQKRKIFDHYIGMQANQLFKQFLNLDASNTIVDNPYLLTYSVFYTKFHLGIQTGFGYSYERIKDRLSPTALQSTITKISYRYGIARSFAIGKKWEASAGVNYIGDYTLNKTNSFAVVNTQSSTQTDSTATISTSTMKRRGGEVQLSLGFHLSEHVMICTEGSFDYFIDRNRSNVFVARTVTNIFFPENDTYTISSSNSDTENSGFETSVPLAIFLTIKF